MASIADNIASGKPYLISGDAGEYHWSDGTTTFAKSTTAVVDPAAIPTGQNPQGGTSTLPTSYSPSAIKTFFKSVDLNGYGALVVVVLILIIVGVLYFRMKK